MGIMDFRKVPDAALPTRLSDGSLNATFVRFRDMNGNPISGDLVTIVVDTATNEIADIIVEAS